MLFSFDDFDALMEHEAADHHHNVPFGDIFDGMKLEWVDPMTGGAPRGPSTTSGPERPEKGDLWNEYVRRLAKPVPSWWTALRS